MTKVFEQTRGMIPMSELKVGDKILSQIDQYSHEYTEVIGWLHKVQD